MSLTLVVLAAGMGSRYGGLKQIDPIGPGGETVLDYAVFDALRTGFTRVLFVIRRDFEVLFREKIGHRYAGRAAVDGAAGGVFGVALAAGAFLAGFRPAVGSGICPVCAQSPGTHSVTLTTASHLRSCGDASVSAAVIVS